MINVNKCLLLVKTLRLIYLFSLNAVDAKVFVLVLAQHVFVKHFKELKVKINWNAHVLQGCPVININESDRNIAVELTKK